MPVGVIILFLRRLNGMNKDDLVKQIEGHIEDAIDLAVTYLNYDYDPCGDSPRMAILTRLLDVKAETGHLQESDIISNQEIIRQEMIRLLTLVDPIGGYSDEDSLDINVPIITLDESIKYLVEAILLYEHFMNSNS